MNIVDKVVAFFSPERAFRRMAHRHALDAMASSALSGYRSGGAAGRLETWRFPQRTDGMPDATSLTRMRRRSNELFRNYGIAAGIADTYADSVIGGLGLTPQSRIRAEDLGIDEGKAEVLRNQAESAWGLFASKACVTGQMTFAEVQHLALRRIIIDGEIFALPVWMRDDHRVIKRAVQLIDAERVWGEKDGFTNGIRVDGYGRVTHYAIEPGNGTSTSRRRPEPVPYAAVDWAGRPRVIHVYFRLHPSQYRGIPLFAPVINLFHDIADYLEAELVAARVAACLAVFITKSDPYAYGLETSESDAHTGEEHMTLRTGEVVRLRPGESINVVDPKRPGDAFDPFVTHVLRMIGASLGLPYELVAKDFSKTNYSSARTALIEARRRFSTWRSFFASKFCQPFYELVLEEAYLRGMFDAPDFYENKHLYCRTSWIGPGWGWVDPVKEVQASVKAIEANLSTIADEAAVQGRDWEDVIAQRARERRRVRELMGSGLEDEEGGGDGA